MFPNPQLVTESAEPRWNEPVATSEHLNESAIMMEPLQFVTANAPGVLRLISEKIKLLEREGRPVTVVSAVGELRIGKSYLLTRILRASLPPGMPFHNFELYFLTGGLWSGPEITTLTGG